MGKGNKQIGQRGLTRYNEIWVKGSLGGGVCGRDAMVQLC